MAAATDYCLATQFAAVKLSELNLGIGPFVVGPAVTRKLGVSAMSQLAIDANTFYPAEWAQQKGLYADVHESAEALDEAVLKLADYLLTVNPEAQRELKTTFWAGCEDWDRLLEQRAELSGRMVLSEFTKQALAK